MIFFTDRDLGSLFPQILSEAGLPIEKHDDHFSDNNTPDDVWLPMVGRNDDWFAISKDKRIRYRQNELDAVMRAGVGLFLIVGHSNHRALAENFVACINKIEQFLNRHDPPFIAKVYQPAPEQRRRGSRKTGRVELWLSYRDWLNRAS